jgi:hypothetical protein
LLPVPFRANRSEMSLIEGGRPMVDAARPSAVNIMRVRSRES